MKKQISRKSLWLACFVVICVVGVGEGSVQAIRAPEAAKLSYEASRAQEVQAVLRGITSGSSLSGVAGRALDGQFEGEAIVRAAVISSDFSDPESTNLDTDPLYRLLREARWLGEQNVASVLDLANSRERALEDLEARYERVRLQLEQTDRELFSEQSGIVKLQEQRLEELETLQERVQLGLQSADAMMVQEAYQRVAEIEIAASASQTRLSELENLRTALAQPYPYLTATLIGIEANREALIAGVVVDTTTGSYIGTKREKVELERRSPERSIFSNGDATQDRPWESQDS